MRRFLVAGLIGGLLALPLATAAQDSGVPYDQVRREYRSMSPVHIKKCDYDSNGFYNNSEMLCVSSIYQQFYLSGNR